MQSSQVALDWAGEYRGVIPCADCEGIKTSLSLKADGSYRKGSLYLGKSDSVYIEQGKFSWDAKSGRIMLEGPSKLQFLVGEGHVEQLDQAGNRIESKLNYSYLLYKLKPDTLIVNKYWRLAEVAGKPVRMTAAWKREPHFVLNKAQSEVQGNGGCNSFFGGYTLEAGNKLRFGLLASTEMFCGSVMDTESAFFEALQLTESFSLSLRGDSLSLQGPKNVKLAVFVVEYLR